MSELDPESKLSSCLAFLVEADVIREPVGEEQRAMVAQIVAAAGDRIMVAGDILQFDGFFVDAEQLPIDETAFEKRLVKPERAGPLLTEYRNILAKCSDTSAANIESELKSWCAEQGIRIGDIIHALRVAITGQAAGFGIFESLEILGLPRSLARIDAALNRLAARR
jgi:glutamyl-tRNA synthetase